MPPGALELGAVTLRKEDAVRLLPLAILLALGPVGALKRWGWRDAPIVAWCLCPLFCGLINQLDWQASAWETIKEFGYWMVPYAIGRVLVCDHSNDRMFGSFILVAAVCYLPPTWYEIFFGPTFAEWITGKEWVGQLRGADRGTTYKPSVFLSSGFVLTMFYVLSD